MNGNSNVEDFLPLCSGSHFSYLASNYFHAFGTPEIALHRCKALSGVPKRHYIAAKHFRGSRNAITSLQSTFGGPETSLHRCKALSGVPKRHYIVAKHFRGSRNVITSLQSTFGGPETPLHRCKALSGVPKRHYIVVKHFREL